MALRQALGITISFGGVLLLVRTIGPDSYGLYAAAFGIHTFLRTLCQFGIGVYLIRMEGEVRDEDYHQAFTLLLLLGAVGSIIALISLPLLERWVRLDGFGPVAAALFLTVPLQLLSIVPMAHLERALNYRRVALVELFSQAIYYVIALPLAFLGFAVWAPVVGWWAQQITLLSIIYATVKYRPRFYWSGSRVKQLIGYGFGLSGSSWIFQLRALVNPLVVARYLGAESAGYVALTIRLVEVLSFVKAATYRLSIAVLARIQEDRSRLIQAISEGMRLQILALGPILIGFGWVAPWLIAFLFGKSWLPVLDIYPFIALGYITNAVFNLHASSLHVLKRNWPVAVFGLVHTSLFAAGAFLIVPHFGLVGYGLAELLATLSYAVLHIYVVRFIGAPAYGLVGVWWIGLVLPLFWRDLGVWTVLGPILVLLWPGTLREIRQYTGYLVKVTHAA